MTALHVANVAADAVPAAIKEQKRICHFDPSQPGAINLQLSIKCLLCAPHGNGDARHVAQFLSFAVRPWSA
jgi:hypothetical protein